MASRSSSAADHAAHDHEGEAFPRKLLAELVGEEERRRSRRRTLEAWVIGAGVASIALGLPSERVWGNLSCVPESALAHAALGSRLRDLALLLGTSAERIWFLVSALAWGTCVPLLTSLLERIGFAPRLALGAALVALLSPLAWITATLPGPFPGGVLGSILLARALFLAPRADILLRIARTNSWFLFAVFLHPQNLLLLPAVLVALLRRDPARVESPSPRRAKAVVWTHGAFALALLLLHLPVARAPGAGDALLRVLLAGRSGGPLEILAWVVVLTLGLGISVLGLRALVVSSRAPEEAPPPMWLRIGCATALVPIVAGSPLWAPGLPWLVPAAAIGVADWIARHPDEQRGTRLLGIALAIQIALAALAAWAFNATDPAKEWRAHTRIVLEPSDVVLTSDPLHAYLLHERWSLAPLLVPAPGDRSTEERRLAESADLLRAARSRIVVDGDPRVFPQPIRDLCGELGAVSIDDLRAPH